MPHTITESTLLNLHAKGYEVTFDSPKYKPRWSRIQHNLHSYMGHKLFLANGQTKMATMLKGIKAPDGTITAISVRRD